MHPSALDNMQKCYWRYFVGSEFETRSKVKVLDMSSGAFAGIFTAANIDYHTTSSVPVNETGFDILAIAETDLTALMPRIKSLLVHDGFAFLVAPRPQNYKALVQQSGCNLVEQWEDSRGPQYDCVGVISPSPDPRHINQAIDNSGPEAVLNDAPKAMTPYEKIQGETPYLETLAFLHKVMEPRQYLEIGIRHGKSMALATCPAVGVDPMPEVTHELPPTARIIGLPSDAYFESDDPSLFAKPDLVFIDGMHHFEYALRDFMNVENMSDPDMIVVIDDILPNTVQQAYRNRETIYWTGDVWKLYTVLEKYRPDLSLILLDTNPTGLLLITGLDSHNRTLWENYNNIVTEALTEWGDPGDDILGRRNAVSPDCETFKHALQVIKNARQKKIPLFNKTARIRQIMDAS